MSTNTKFTLNCPVRGILKASKKSKDGLTPSEEYFRVQAIKHLIEKGYPKENFKIEPILKKFGHGGKNSFRSDFAVLDVEASSIPTKDIDKVIEHAILICEVKRDNAKADYVKNTQVQPMLDFSKRDDCIGLYWDNIEQRIFWEERKGKKKETHEGSLSLIPEFGNSLTVSPITFSDTAPSDSLLEVFDRIEDILHQASYDLQKRYEIILQLLLAKIYDEHAFENQTEKPTGFQDFSVIGTSPSIALKKINSILKKAVSYYEKHLPNKISSELPLSGETLIEILKLLSPVRIIHSKRDVVQTFYMKFAKDLYKWDLAQFFTPTTVTDFIVDVLNPQFGEHINDPACGSADFLIAAFHKGRKFDSNYADCIWGADNSSNAVQISVLNMLLNGDGKTNISKEDSLENISNRSEKYEMVVCNPPFGKRIVEKRPSVLRQYEMGFEWAVEEGRLHATEKILAAQETGILFAEVCMRQVKESGRVGIILPNGYLGNRSLKYRAFRDWLLRNARIISICAFPRFTFKTSGADVSASVLFFEKRDVPLESALDDEDYAFNVEVIEKVGWDAGNKRAMPVYIRNPDDGSFLINPDGDLIIDADFDSALKRIRGSDVTDFFDWVDDGVSEEDKEEGWSVPISAVLEDDDFTLDPKRYCKKISELRNAITEKSSITLGEIVDFMPERHDSNGKRVSKDDSSVYRYVEIAGIEYGEYRFNEYKGWELADRAKHFAESGDIYIGSIWSSVTKWCYIGSNASSTVVTNGCHRMRLKEGKEEYLLDLLTFLSTEAYATQMRAFARGSDGLAEVPISDVAKIVMPLIEDEKVREIISPLIDNLIEGKTSLKSAVTVLMQNNEIDIPLPDKRPSHIALV